MEKTCECCQSPTFCEKSGFCDIEECPLPSTSIIEHQMQLSREAAERERRHNPFPSTKLTNTDALPANPKQIFGDKKVPVGMVSPIAIAHEALALLDGNMKYGQVNWRAASVEVMTYVHAMQRHIQLYLEGEECDPATGVHHLGYVRAGAAILLDAAEHGKLIDNRPLSGAYNSDFMARLGKVAVGLRKLHEGKSPRHYTIADRGKF